MIDTPTSSREEKPLQANPPRKTRVWMLFGLAAVTLLAMAYGGWWYVISRQVELAMDHWIAGQKRQGTDIQIDRRDISGFPAQVRINLVNPSARHEGAISWAWKTNDLTLSIKPWSVNRVGFELGQMHDVTYRTRTENTVVHIQVSEATGAFSLKSGRFHSIDVRLRDMKAGSSRLKTPTEISDADITLEAPAGAPPEFYLRLRGLQIPSELNAPLGDRVDYLDVRGNVTGDVLSGPLPDVLAYWRQSGGTIDISRLDMSYLPLRVRGNGTVALDEYMQPVAAFSVQANGFFETVDALHAKGLIPLATTFATKVALGVLSKTPADGGEAYLEIPITVQDQVVYAGTIALFKLRPVSW